MAGGRRAVGRGRGRAAGEEPGRQQGARTGPGRGHLNSRAPRQERVAKEEAEPAACRPKQQWFRHELDQSGYRLLPDSVIICALGAGKTQYIHFHWPITTLTFRGRKL